MGGFCALLGPPGSTPPPERLERMLAAAAARGPDGRRTVFHGEFALGHLAFHTTPEAVRETQPLWSRDRQHCLAADARIDNRAELIHTLSVDGDLAERDPTDVELILAAYRRWGTECPRHLVGDFGFVVWDVPARRLFGARDGIGLRPFHYAREGATFIAASSVASVLAALERPATENEELLRDLLANEYRRWREETCYTEVRRLPPGHWMTVEAGRLRMEEYWRPGMTLLPRCADEREYVDGFREVLTEAVRARTRSISPVGLLVSGGLDSSSIACILARDQAAGSIGVPLRFYSSVFDSTPAANEREYLEAVAAQCPDVPLERVPADQFWALREFGTDRGYPLVEPEIDVNRGLLLEPARQARADGCRVLMGGNGGDQVLGGHPYYRPDILRDVPFRAWPRELPHFRRCSRRGTAWILAYAFLRPLVPAPLARWVAERRAHTAPEYMPAPLAPLRPGPPRSRPQGPGGRTSFVSRHQLTSGLYAAYSASLDHYAEYLDLEWRYPYLDRRVVDYTLGLPPRVRFRDGCLKRVLREAMHGLLPEVVRQRTGFAHFSELIDRGLRERERVRIQQLIHASRVAARGWLPPDSLNRGWSNYWNEHPGAWYHSLTGFLCVETWLRSGPLPVTRQGALPGSRENA